MFNCQRLKNRRLELDMTLEDVGNVAGIHRSAVQKYEKGIIKNVQVSTVELFAKALRCNPAYLLDWVDVPEIEVNPSGTLPLSNKEIDLITTIRSLNEEGQEKAYEYIDDIAASGKYIKNSQLQMDKREIG